MNELGENACSKWLSHTTEPPPPPPPRHTHCGSSGTLSNPSQNLTIGKDCQLHVQKEHLFLEIFNLNCQHLIEIKKTPYLRKWRWRRDLNRWMKNNYNYCVHWIWQHSRTASSDSCSSDKVIEQLFWVCHSVLN